MGFVFLLPQYLNSANFNRDVNNFLIKNFKLKYESEGFKFKTKYNLRISLDAGKISIYKDFDQDGEIEDEEKLFYTENLHISAGTFKHNTIHFTAENLIFNSDYLKEILPHTKTKSKAKFNLYDYISQIYIKHALVIFSNDKNDKFRFDISDLELKKTNKKSYVTFSSVLTSELLRNDIKIGGTGGFEITENSLMADNLPLNFGDANVIINGLIRNGEGKTNFSVKGNDIPVDDLEASLLYFQKLRKKDKVFIENFYDWGGIIDLDLEFTNAGVFGKCKADDLFAKSVLFNVPILFKEAEFLFNGREVTSIAFGTIGFDKVASNFSLTNMATPEQTVEGTVESDLHNQSVSTYVPNTSVKGSAITTVKYHVKNHKIHVDYSVKVNKGSNLYYNDINLGLEDKNRMLVVNTFKHDDVLEITNYNYSMSDGKETDIIVTGEGLFRKKPKKLKLEYITCKTDGYAPLSVAGSFGDYLHGGEFKGDLTYFYENQQIIGDFSVINSRFKRFHIGRADFKADKEKMDFSAEGTFRDEVFQCSASAKNDFRNRSARIYNMDLFLDKYIIGKRPQKPKNINPNSFMKFNRQMKNSNITIDKWKIRLNKIIKDRIVFDNIIVSGALINDVFNFVSSDIGFAKGTMSANGIYNFNTRDSIIDFSAENIDSEVVADTVFNLPDQIAGIASAKIHAKANDRSRTINAHADFNIKQGALTKLGDKEFYLRKSNQKHPWKTSLQQAINVDVTKEAFTSDLKGSFDLNNSCLENILVTSQQKYLAFAISGDYNIDSQHADLMVFGKFNRDKQKGIKVYHIPLSIITRLILRPEKSQHSYTEELKNVPQIEGDKNDIRTFRVKLHGNLNNTDSLKVELKRIEEN